MLRLWASRATLERDVFLNGGLELPKAALEEMMRLDLPGLQGRLSRYSFYDTVAPHLPELEAGTVGLLERELEKLHLREASRYSAQHPLSVLPVLDYIIAKEIEVQNLRIIAHGKAVGLTTEQIQELLVV